MWQRAFFSEEDTTLSLYERSNIHQLRFQFLILTLVLFSMVPITYTKMMSSQVKNTEKSLFLTKAQISGESSPKHPKFCFYELYHNFRLHSVHMFRTQSPRPDSMLRRLIANISFEIFKKLHVSLNLRKQPPEAHRIRFPNQINTNQYLLTQVTLTIINTL